MEQKFQSPFPRQRVKGIRKIILVGSGKGGVGKSTVAVNLALALSYLGNEVGFLDADIYGPSAPTLLGLKGERISANENNKLIPIGRYGLKVVSIGFMLPSEDTPLIWRGPMLLKAVSQMLFDTDWGILDYLVVDLPPGTGDVQLTLAQTTIIDGAIVVTTPQDLSLVDVKKAVNMFKRVEVPILGVVENMAYFICPDSKKKYYIFGKGKTLEFARTYNLKVLGSIPIDPRIAEGGDLGLPIVVEEPESEVAKAFINIAKLIDKGKD